MLLYQETVLQIGIIPGRLLQRNFGEVASVGTEDSRASSGAWGSWKGSKTSCVFSEAMQKGIYRASFPDVIVAVRPRNLKLLGGVNAKPQC